MGADVTGSFKQLALSFVHRRARTSAGEWVAPGHMRLRVSRSVWHANRRRCFDARGLALRNAWEPSGSHREVVCERELGERVVQTLRALGIEVDVLDGGPT